VKILVYPHLMEIGGSQLNAIELAGRVSQRGHDVVLFGPDGALVSVVDKLGLEYIRSPREHAWPSARNIARLRQIVRERDIDVVHGYEWGPSVELAFGAQLLAGVPIVTTVMSMSVPTFLPRRSSIVVGTAELERQQKVLRSRVHLMEPPIDTVQNAASDNREARKRFGFEGSDVVAAIVCRLTTDLDKLQGTLTAITAFGRLAAEASVRLLVVGDGPGFSEVCALAAAVNAQNAREVVVVTGEMIDPSDAYNAADVVLGMGSSAMKGMAFARPLIVQGTNGYWRLLDESSLPTFLDQGWFGANGGGADDLIPIMGSLLACPERRSELGALGRDLVIDRFSLDAAANHLIDIYGEAVRVGSPGGRRELARTAYELAKFKAKVKAVRFGQA